MKLSVKAYIISGTVALLAIIIYSYVPQSIPVDPNGKTSQPNKSESGVAKPENATPKKSAASQNSNTKPIIAKEPIHIIDPVNGIFLNNPPIFLISCS